MSFKKAVIAAATAALGMGALIAAPAAQAQEQFVPLLVYRTGQFAPLGIPWGDGKLVVSQLVGSGGPRVSSVSIGPGPGRLGRRADREGDPCPRVWPTSPTVRDCFPVSGGGRA